MLAVIIFGGAGAGIWIAREQNAKLIANAKADSESARADAEKERREREATEAMAEKER